MSFLFGGEGGIQPLRVLRPCGIAASDFAPKNCPPDSFLNGAHPLRIRIPPDKKEKHQPLRVAAFFLAEKEGL